MFREKRTDFVEHFFLMIRANVDVRDRQELEALLDPVRELDPECSVDRLFAPLASAHFPEAKTLSTVGRFDTVRMSLDAGESPFSEVGNYKWCIEEFLGVEGVKARSVWTRFYLIALHSYCDRIEPSVQTSDFLILLFGDGSVVDDKKASNLFAQFIEWLCEEVQRSEDYDDYFVLLSWLFLRRAIGGTTEPQFLDVKNELLSRRYTHEQLIGLAGSKETLDGWYRLHSDTPLRYGASTDEFRRIVFGADGGSLDA